MPIHYKRFVPQNCRHQKNRHEYTFDLLLKSKGYKYTKNNLKHRLYYKTHKPVVEQFQETNKTT